MLFRLLPLITFLGLALTSCEESYISAHTDYLSHENLASYVIKTPDPLLNNPPVGQRLIVSWSVPRTYMCAEDLHLVITIRFRNRTSVVENLAILKRKGTFVYPVMNEDYFATRGILTYKVDLMNGEDVLEEWRHQIWTELITISHEDQQQDTEMTVPVYTPDANFYDEFE